MRYSQRRRTGVNVGLEAAKKHIDEAQQLSIQLGGTDKDVKAWFFNLPPHKLEDVFERYSSAYGKVAGDYARSTFGDWKSGRRQMSGVVASRLFNLLPPIMPLETKFKLVESLWSHVCPSKKRLIVAGASTPIEEIIDTVMTEVRTLATNWEIPEAMQNRFRWLAQQDSVTYQKLLQHIKEMEKKLGESILKDQIPILKNKFDTDLSETTSRISYVINVGKQSVELRLVNGSVPLSAKDWVPADARAHVNKTSEYNGIPVWVWVILVILVLFFLSNF